MMNHRISKWRKQFLRGCKKKKNWLAVGAMLLLFIVSIAERITFKVLVDRMESYRYFFAQMIAFVYIPPMFTVVAAKVIRPNSVFDEEMTNFPKYRFLMMGFLDLCHSMSLLLAGGHTPAPLTVILMQGMIPMTVLISRIYFRIRYSNAQYLGAGLIFSGSAIAIGPIFMGVFSSDFQHQQVGWNSLVYFLASVPGAISMLYKEQAIRKFPMDIWYLNAWVSTYQFMLGLFIAPMIFDFEILHLNQKISGFECLFYGIGSTSFDLCEGGILILSGYVISTVLMNVLIFQVMENASVSQMYVTMLASFPVSCILMELYQSYQAHQDALNNDGLATTVFSNWMVDIVGILFTVVGLVFYRSNVEPGTEAWTISAAEMEASCLLEDEVGDKEDGLLRYT